MTVERARFQPSSEAAIMEAMLAAAEESFERELSDDETAAIVHFAEPFAAYFAEQQQGLREVLDSAQIDHASGDALDFLAALIGVPRLEERPSEVRVQYWSDTPVTRNYSIPESSQSQTDNTDPVIFETDYATEIPYVDGFEDGNIDEYGGDTGSYTTQTGTTYQGTHALEATSGGSILSIQTEIEYGSRIHYRTKLASSASGGLIFGATDINNHYDIEIDDSAGSVAIGLTEGGSRSELNSSSISVDTSKWYHVQIDWRINGTIEATVFDDTGEVASVEASEPTSTHVNGGVGYRSASAESLYFDEVTTSRISVPATATEASAETNVAPETVVVLGTELNGIDSVTNPLASVGGRDREPDAEYRERAKDELSQGTSATLPAIINALDQLPQTKTVTVIDNDSDTADADGRPAHSFEPLVDAPEDAYDDIADSILNVKAAGDTSVGGYAGSSVTRQTELINGQEKDITFSIPTPVQLYIDVDLEVMADQYPGDDRIRSSVVQYTGGVLATENNTDGEIGVGNNIVYNQVLEAIMNINGVYDVTNLEIGTASNPTGTDNITIEDSENATADATNGSLDVDSTEV